jgi:hypothetical protein
MILMSRIDENPYKIKTRMRLIPTGYQPRSDAVSYAGLHSTAPITSGAIGDEMCDLQVTVSEGHPFWSSFKDFKGIKPDIGGDFLTTKWKPFVDKTIYFGSFVDSAHRLWQCQGPIIPSIRDSYGTASEGWGYLTKHTTNLGAYMSKFPAVSSTDNELIALGTTAIARTRPDVSPASVTQFLVELRRDGLPFAKKLSQGELKRLIHEFNKKGATKTTSKEAGDFFLEDQFGLKPFISDLQSFVKVLHSGNSTLDNLIKNSGKIIRRSYKFPDENISTTKGARTTGSLFGFSHLPDFASTDGQWFTSMDGRPNPLYSHSWDVKTLRKTWFSGAYQIYMPKDMEPVSRLHSIADHLRWDYGLDLNFDTLWNLAPWSWLLDWEVNMGDLITNLSKWSQDAVVLQYGYVMQETKTSYIVAPRSAFLDSPAVDVEPSRLLPSMGVEVHRKRRIRATPYGFGKSFGSLSGNQKTILAAIGITRF